MARGFKSGGRHKGVPNKRTAQSLAAQAEAAAKIAAALGDAFEGNAYELLVATYKDKALPLDVRLDAARTALPFEMPKLQAIEHSGKIDSDVTISDEIRARVIDDLMDEIDGKSRNLVGQRAAANGLDDDEIEPGTAVARRSLGH